jgi:predicted nucleic acid-binding protein
MLLYLDTSALVKLYVKEAHSDEVVKLLKQSDAAASHQLGYVEFHAAIARRQREGLWDDKTYQTVKQEFKQDWESYMVVKNNESLMLAAAELAEAFSLRAYDSVHLAAAQYLHNTARSKFMFACFDQRLNLAAKMLKIERAEWPGS